jgi:hypothetical protein
MVRNLNLKDDEEGKRKKMAADSVASQMYDLDTRIDIDIKNIFEKIDRLIEDAGLDLDKRELKKKILDNIKDHVR